MALRYFNAKPLCPSHQMRGVGQGAFAISSSSSRPPFTGWIMFRGVNPYNYAAGEPEEPLLECGPDSAFSPDGDRLIFW